MNIVPIETLNDAQRTEAAFILMTALAFAPSAWHDMKSAREEVDRCVDDPERMAIVLCDEERVIGWGGAILQSDHNWELHPLVVHPASQGRGYGAALLRAIESEASAAGVTTMWLGSDDDFGGTNLYGIDLYPNVLAKLAKLKPTAGHPYTFYAKNGYAVVGVLPDASGPGKHDILLAKRLSAPEAAQG